MSLQHYPPSPESNERTNISTSNIPPHTNDGNQQDTTSTTIPEIDASNQQDTTSNTVTESNTVNQQENTLNASFVTNISTNTDNRLSTNNAITNPSKVDPSDGNHQKEDSKCSICLCSEISHILVPCDCFILCAICSTPDKLLGYKRCPICRRIIHGCYQAGYNKNSSAHIVEIIPKQNETFILEDDPKNAVGIQQEEYSTRNRNEWQ